MKFQAKITDVTKVEADMVAVFAGTDEAKKVDTALGGMLTEVAKTEDFEDKQGKLLLIHTHGKIPAKRVLLVGNPEEPTIANWQKTFASIGRKAKEVAALRIAIRVSDAKGVVEGLVLGTYTFSKHKSEEARKKEKHIEEVLLLVHPARLTAIFNEIKREEVMSEAVVFARDLVNEPPSVTTPSYLANVAKKLPGIRCQVFGKKEMKELGMEALLGIARGSDEEPKFIRLDYKGGGNLPAGRQGKTICLVGKGITFDTGGLSLKPSSSMETMKLDMAGAAAILAIFKVLPMLKPRVNVVGLIAATENMPGPHAIKPGDIVRAMNGKTIEILNTDAEGRVVLADALSYAGKIVKPDVLIDLATLTGACMVALGEEITGLFGTNSKLTADLKESAKNSGENVWEMPLAKEYKEMTKSSVADIKNTTATKYGGAITAALFLQEFVPEKTPWVHLDIAGPSFAEKDAPLTPVGGTGFGVRMLLHYLGSI